MKTTYITLAFALVSSLAWGKSMVLFNADSSCTVMDIASTDSGRFSGGGSALDFFSLGAPTSTSLSTLDSIRFFDGAAVLTPDMLFNAAYAHPAITDSLKTYVTLDLRNRTAADTTVIITDALDLVDMANGGVSNLADVQSALVLVRASVPGNAWVKVYWSAGDDYFGTSNWSSWSLAPGRIFTVNSPNHRYLKLRLVLKAASVSSLPLIKGVTVCADLVPATRYTKALQVSSYDNEKIVTGPYAFGWETRDQAKIADLVTRFRLDTCGTDSATEFGKVVALLDWVARRPKGPSPPDPYPWNLDLVMTTGGTINGHCMSYAEVMVSALTGLGMYARHWAIEGIDNANNHEVVEYWSDHYKKWIYLDPSLDTYYKSVATGIPNSILENHNFYIYRQLMAISVVDAKYHYGVYTPTYNWRGLQGYTTCGYMKLTERNNFHTQPTPIYDGFGWGFCGGFTTFNFWHNWTDWKTPPYYNVHYDCGADTLLTCQSGRVRDYWYTLNQASIKAKRSGESEITAEFGNSQPFFNHYIVSIDGAAATTTASPYTWTLHSGTNTLTVTPVNNYEEEGLTSTISVVY